MSRWNFAFASAIGTSHIKTDVPCQDFASCTVLQHHDGSEILIAAVSDGAGSAQRSQDGSRICCETFIRQASDYVQTHSVSELQKEHIADWIKAIRAEIESIAMDSDLKSRDFACTLLAIISDKENTVYVQIGDGGIVTSDGSDLWQCIFWPQKGEFANMTNFITDHAALNNLEFLSSSVPISEVAIFTDGIENLVLNHAEKTAFSPWFENMFVSVRKSNDVGENKYLSSSLSDYLSSPMVCERTDDDKSLILATKLREKFPLEISEKICAQQH